MRRRADPEPSGGTYFNVESGNLVLRLGKQFVIVCWPDSQAKKEGYSLRRARRWWRGGGGRASPMDWRTVGTLSLILRSSRCRVEKSDVCMVLQTGRLGIIGDWEDVGWCLAHDCETFNARPRLGRHAIWVPRTGSRRIYCLWQSWNIALEEEAQ